MIEVLLRRFMVAIVTIAIAGSASAQQPAACAAAVECRQLARDAIATKQFERAHDLAWLAYQKGPKQDPETLTLIARAQSLSGRADDALVMLRRLAESGVAVADLNDSSDFARVRNHPQFEQLRAVFAAIAQPGASPALAGHPAAAPSPSVTPKIPAPPVPATASATAVPRPKRATEDIALPQSMVPPVAIAHDAVSARFVFAYANTDALMVLSQTSTNAAAFTSNGWSASESTTALAIDRAAGDLWVAVRDQSGAALHRLQLISGRRLDVIKVDGDAALTAIAVTRDALFVLDSLNRKVMRRAAQAKTLTAFVSLPDDVVPTSLTVGRNALYVAHTTGVLRVDLTTRAQRPLAGSKPGAIANLYSLAWNDGALMGVQRTGDDFTVVSVRLNAAGSRVTRTQVLERAASPTATLAGGIYYFTTASDAGGVVLRAGSLQ